MRCRYPGWIDRSIVRGGTSSFASPDLLIRNANALTDNAPSLPSSLPPPQTRLRIHLLRLRHSTLRERLAGWRLSARAHPNSSNNRPLPRALQRTTSCLSTAHPRRPLSPLCRGTAAWEGWGGWGGWERPREAWVGRCPAGVGWVGVWAAAPVLATMGEAGTAACLSSSSSSSPTWCVRVCVYMCVVFHGGGGGGGGVALLVI